jgi:hypothetical protein
MPNIVFCVWLIGACMPDCNRRMAALFALLLSRPSFKHTKFFQLSVVTHMSPSWHGLDEHGSAEEGEDDKEESDASDESEKVDELANVHTAQQLSNNKHVIIARFYSRSNYNKLRIKKGFFIKCKIELKNFKLKKRLTLIISTFKVITMCIYIYLITLVK